MKRCLWLSLLSLVACGLIPIHKVPVQQGNVITQKMVNKLHEGLSASQVRDLLGDPVLVNTFDERHAVYVYTYSDSNTPMVQKHLNLTFKHGRLKDYTFRR